MQRLLITAVLLVATSAPLAARPNTLSMSCKQAQRLLASQGAVVMSTGKHTYDRFVVSGDFCEVAEWAYTATAPTKDTRACPLGYTCSSTPPIWFDNDRDGGLFSGR